MATNRQIEVTAEVDANGDLQITVHPFAQKVKKNETVQWKIQGTGLQWVQLSDPGTNAYWPFDDTPASNPYAYLAQKGLKSAKTPGGRKPGLPNGDRIKYNVKVGFDVNGRIYTASIDPDMVIDGT